MVKKPIYTQELYKLEGHYFTTDRLNVVLDVFVFLCYTGFIYIEVYQLKKIDIKKGIDGNLWIMSERQKTNSFTNIPLLPQALEIIKKNKENSLCLQRGSK